MDVYMKPIKIGRNAWEYVRNIQPICSNLGHSWQGRFFSSKKQNKTFFNVFDILQKQFWTGIGYIDAD